MFFYFFESNGSAVNRGFLTCCLLLSSKSRVSPRLPLSPCPVLIVSFSLFICLSRQAFPGIRAENPRPIRKDIFRVKPPRKPACFYGCLRINQHLQNVKQSFAGKDRPTVNRETVHGAFSAGLGPFLRDRKNPLSVHATGPSGYIFFQGSNLCPPILIKFWSVFKSFILSSNIFFGTFASGPSPAPGMYTPPARRSLKYPPERPGTKRLMPVTSRSSVFCDFHV